MQQNTYSVSYLSDKQWIAIEPLTKPTHSLGRARSIDMKLVVDAIMYQMRTGCRWRALPKHYPHWSSVYHYYDKWKCDGTLYKILSCRG